MHSLGKDKAFLPLLLTALLSALFCYLVYHLSFLVIRKEVSVVLGLFFVLFGLGVVLIKYGRVGLKELFILGVLARFITLFALPELSDDYCRFLWDGYLSVEGINPYEFIPSDIVKQGLLDQPMLYEKMNSPAYYSVYPAMNQYIYWLSAFASGGDFQVAVLVMKLLMFLCEIGTLFLLFLLMRHDPSSKWKFGLYALNPLVIMEFCGNLHAEGYMVFFVLLALYVLTTKKWWLSAVFLSIAICLKMIPVLTLPFVIKRLGWKKGVVYSLLVGMVVVLLFLPFYEPFVMSNIGESLSLYFGVFEFNSSVYRVVQYFGIEDEWYTRAGLKLMVVIVLLWSWISYKPKDHKVEGLFKALYPVFLVYALLSQSIHPWYVLPLYVYSLYSNTWLPWVWSVMIVLTYTTYQNPENYNQNPYLIGVEYLFLAVIGLFEFIRQPKFKK